MRPENVVLRGSAVCGTGAVVMPNENEGFEGSILVANEKLLAGALNDTVDGACIPNLNDVLASEAEIAGRTNGRESGALGGDNASLVSKESIRSGLEFAGVGLEGVVIFEGTPNVNVEDGGVRSVFSLVLN